MSAEAAATATLVTLRPTTARRRPLVPRAVRKLIGPVLLLAIWTLASHLGWLTAEVLPSPTDIGEAFLDLVRSGELADALLLSLQRVGLGFAIGLTVGLCLAVISGLLALGEDLVDAPVQMVRTMPWSGLIPLLIIWFGIGEEPKVALVALAVTFPIYVNTFGGIRNVDEGLVEAARTMRFGRWKLIRHVVLPGALPSGLVGLRYALGSAWLALVFAEQVNSQGGIGYLLTHAREVYRIDIIVVCLIIYALLGLITDLIVRFLEKAWLAWRPTLRAN